MKKPVLDKERMMCRIARIIKRSIASVLIVCLLCSIATPAFGGTYTCPENPLLPYVISQTPWVDNSVFPYVARPKTAENRKYSPRYLKTPYNEVANTLTPSQVFGAGDTYKTTAFLPLFFTRGGAYNPQSIAIVNPYIYVLYSKGSTTNQGFVVQYNYDLMQKYGLTSGSGMNKLRSAFAGRIAPASAMNKNTKSITAVKKKLKAKGKKAPKKAQRKKLRKRLAVLRKRRVTLKKRAAEQTRIKTVAKVGPTITVGHGQSLAYNPVRKELWMWLDLHNADGTWKNPNKGTFQRISTSTLKVTATVDFYMTNGKNNTPVSSAHNLTFDKRGDAYFWKSSETIDNKLFKAKITPSSIKVELVQLFTHKPGTYAQSLGYNPATDRLYFISDDVLMTMPVSKIGSGSLTVEDMTYATYSSKREFEGLAFDSKGYGYLALNRGPEIVKTTAPAK